MAVCVTCLCPDEQVLQWLRHRGERAPRPRVSLRARAPQLTPCPVCVTQCDECDGSTRGPIPSFNCGDTKCTYTGKPIEFGPMAPICGPKAPAPRAKGTSMNATICDPKQRTVNTGAKCGAPDDFFFHSPWRAPGYVSGGALPCWSARRVPRTPLLCTANVRVRCGVDDAESSTPMPPRCLRPSAGPGHRLLRFRRRSPPRPGQRRLRCGVRKHHPLEGGRLRQQDPPCPRHEDRLEDRGRVRGRMDDPGRKPSSPPTHPCMHLPA